MALPKRFSLADLTPLDFYFSSCPDSVSNFTIYESKDFSDGILPASRKAVIDTFQTSSKQSDIAKQSFEKLQQQYLRAFNRSLASAASGRKGYRDTRSTLKKALEVNFLKAYAIGRTSSGEDFIKNFKITKQELDFVKKAAKQELGFAEKFLKQTIDSGNVNSVRVGMYGRSLEAMFTNGWLSSIPEDSIIYWKLGHAEHCIDCLALAAESPYQMSGKNFKKLPVVPRSGGSRCLSNCKCDLHIVLPDEQGKVEELKDPLFLQSPLVTKGETIDDDFRTAERLYQRINELRQRITLAKPGTTNVNSLISARTRTTQRLIALQDKVGKNYVPAFSAKEVNQTANMVSGLKELSFASVKEGQNIVILRNIFSTPAVVTKRSSRSIKATTPYGDVEIKPEDSFLFFEQQKSTLNESFPLLFGVDFDVLL